MRFDHHYDDYHHHHYDGDDGDDDDNCVGQPIMEVSSGSQLCREMR